MHGAQLTRSSHPLFDDLVSWAPYNCPGLCYLYLEWLIVKFGILLTYLRTCTSTHVPSSYVILDVLNPFWSIVSSTHYRGNPYKGFYFPVLHRDLISEGYSSWDFFWESQQEIIWINSPTTKVNWGIPFIPRLLEQQIEDRCELSRINGKHIPELIRYK